MKQHISAEQLNELSDKGKEKLANWFSDKNYTADFYWSKNEDLPFVFPIPNIGQLVEFLMEHDKHRSFISWGREISFGGATWFGKIEHDKKRNAIVFRDGFGFGELVNTLWEACKEILNDKK